MKQRTDFYEMVEDQYSNMGKVKRNELGNTKGTKKEDIKQKDINLKTEKKIHLVLFLACWFLSYFV